MADRELRALDMRHTLPNLKNLLLTLTDGEGAQLSGPRAFNSPEQTLTGLESPRAESPVVETANGSGTTPTTPKAVEYSTELPAEGNTPPPSFLRARYPSAIRTPTPTKVTEAEASEPSIEEPAINNGEDRIEDDDRRTIRGDIEAVIEEASANATDGAERGSEKLGDVPAPAKPPPPVTPIK
ncbi:hypothetical protein K438DRAFT_1106362 [Mycena galopus ATCC 62051]|nr:hypothetical protein K438DRAFT_1106362 [Mycena galopus ATCC 62051]